MRHLHHPLPIRIPTESLLDQIRASLRCLGETPGEVLWSLLYEGVKGMRSAAFAGNPVVGYLSRRMDVAGRLEIPLGSTELIVRFDGTDHRIPLPPAVLAFLDRFQNGDYRFVELT